MPYPSSRRGLTFAEAVEFLGAEDGPVMSVLGQSGRPGADPPDVLDARSVCAEIVEWGRRVVRDPVDRHTGLGRYHRTRWLVAVHSVIVVRSFFEAVEEEVEDEELVKAEIFGVLATAEVPLPSPGVPGDSILRDVRWYHQNLFRVMWLPARLMAAKEMNSAILRASWQYYEAAYRSLAQVVPEFAIWAAAASMPSTGAGSSDRLTTGLAGVREMLGGLTGGVATPRSDLATRYRLQLDSPIIDVGNLPDGIRLPTVATLYVNPRARMRQAAWQSPVAAESWWAEAVELDDVEPFLAGYLTSVDATIAPLIVLGQPGSGKSMLSRVLAAVLPPEEFLPVRVELRAVSADASVQHQIEEAVHLAIGEEVCWPDLVRSAGGALPVVMLDGFDELLQASGLNRADYLEQVRDFQQREADLGRPVAVLVTSRTVVADRARVPAGSIVLRLDPFDDTRIERWLDVWAATNASGLDGRSLVPLPAKVAWRYRELAEQPLLLLMLALYDAWENALQRTTGELDRAELYERLFTDFARREIGKRERVISLDREHAAIEREVHRLALVAMAMFARGLQVVPEEQLDADLRVLLCDDLVGRTDAPDRPLTAAQLLVGRFFFIHESRAREGTDVRERSFEFLHATFGEFLVARLVVGTLVDLAAERAHQARRPYPAPVDAGRLYAWLSFAVLAGRAPVVEFCRVLVARLADPVREQCRGLLRDLFRDAAFPHPSWSLAGWEPIRRPIPERHAAFTANVVSLIVLVDDPHEVNVAELGGAWRSTALLWESQLPGDAWRSLWQTLRMTHRHIRKPKADGMATAHQSQAWLALEQGWAVALNEALPWEPTPVVTTEKAYRPFLDVSIPASSAVGMWLREAAFRHDDGMSRVLAHSVAPFWQYIRPGHAEILDAYPSGTDLEALLALLLAPRDAGTRSVRWLVAAYHTCLELLGGTKIQRLILRELEDDAAYLDADAVLEVLSKFVDKMAWTTVFLRGVDMARIARILVRVRCDTAEPGLIRSIYQPLEANNPGERPFSDVLREEFARGGVAFPEEVFVFDRVTVPIPMPGLPDFDGPYSGPTLYDRLARRGPIDRGAVNGVLGPSERSPTGPEDH